LAEGPKSLELALARGVSTTRLYGEGKDAFAYALEHLQRYGELPNPDFVVGKTGILLDAPEGPALQFIDEVNNRHLHIKIQEGLKQVVDLQEKRQPSAAYTELEKLVVDLRAEQIGLSNVESLFKLGPEIIDYYKRIQEGERGVLTPWDKVNNATLGFWPEDLILFVARVGIGKTWTAVLLALHAWRTPKPKTGVQQRVLFITTEVSRMRIGMRFYAAMERLPYQELTHGQLDKLSAEPRFFRAVEELYNAEGLYIIGGDFDFQIESISSAIETSKPDIVVLDGVYLLRGPGATRNEKMANTFDEMKRLAKRKKVPILITTQFNREVKSKDMEKTVDVSAIALSDVGAWNADLIYALIQDKDMKQEKRMMLKPLKVREGSGEDVLINWDFSRMNFSELITSGGQGGDADEFGVPKLATDPDTDIIDPQDMPF
jgi:replicative DNA helicase